MPWTRAKTSPRAPPCPQMIIVTDDHFRLSSQLLQHLLTTPAVFLGLLQLASQNHGRLDELFQGDVRGLWTGPPALSAASSPHASSSQGASSGVSHPKSVPASAVAAAAAASSPHPVKKVALARVFPAPIVAAVAAAAAPAAVPVAIDIPVVRRGHPKAKKPRTVYTVYEHGGDSARTVDRLSSEWLAFVSDSHFKDDQDHPDRLEALVNEAFFFKLARKIANEDEDGDAYALLFGWLTSALATANTQGRGAKFGAEKDLRSLQRNASRLPWTPFSKASTSTQSKAHAEPLHGGCATMPPPSTRPLPLFLLSYEFFCSVFFVAFCVIHSRCVQVQNMFRDQVVSRINERLQGPVSYDIKHGCQLSYRNINMLRRYQFFDFDPINGTWVPWKVRWCFRSGGLPMSSPFICSCRLDRFTRA